MANQQQLLNLSPYEISDVPAPSPDVVPQDPPDIVQLKLDIINVLEDRVPMSSFTPEYQAKIRNFYRFYGQRSIPSNPLHPRMTRSTLEAI